MGSYARAIYAADNQEYEGKILSLGESEGVDYVVLEFVGYKVDQC